jgi:hypothetical protein
MGPTSVATESDGEFALGRVMGAWLGVRCECHSCPQGSTLLTFQMRKPRPRGRSVVIFRIIKWTLCVRMVAQLLDLGSVWSYQCNSS